MAQSHENAGKREEENSEFVDKLVHINRVAKVVKGGRRFGFAALVVVGDEKGRVGFGHGKAREVPEAIRKASDSAKQDMIFVPLRDGRTLHHDVKGRHGAGKVVLRSAPAGTGIIAGGPMRAVFETVGMSDVVAKSIGSSNPYNMVRATFDALKRQMHPKDIAAQRGLKYGTLQSRRREWIGGDESKPEEKENKPTAKKAKEAKKEVKKDAKKDTKKDTKSATKSPKAKAKKDVKTESKVKAKAKTESKVKTESKAKTATKEDKTDG